MKVEVHGKCILLGEHSVVRGEPALVFPLQSKKLRLEWKEENGGGLEVSAGDYAQPFRLILERALELLGKKLPGKKWSFTLVSEIPVRAGLGSSAALSVATVRFLEKIGIQSSDPFALALELENIFHGSSSGIDVAATLSEQPILFRRHAPPEPLSMAWQPKLYLFDSGLRSSTKACVEQVMALARPELDQRMGELVGAAKNALATPNGKKELANAMNEAADIFREWNLVPTAVEQQMQQLKSAGALAVKPTGSGNGGYILSLWESPAPKDLIPLAADF
ncbi:MAG: mevalonate kinase [Bacteriovoracia bacterium]